MTDDAEQDYITTREAADLLRLSHNQAYVVLKENECEWREVNPKLWKWRRADVEAVCELRGHNQPRVASVRPITEDDGKGDHCGANGAWRLKARIESYWRERGGVVNVRTVEAAYVTAMRTARFDVRSDMLDGWPREWIESK